jgi:S1-C subfamily serine protease
MFSFRPMTAVLGILVCAIAIAIAAQTTPPTSATTAGAAQNPAQEKPQRRPSTRRPPLPPARVTVVPNQMQLGPQVVTVVHRLTGVKLLRLLQRQSGETFTIENIDPLTLMADAHASILAGWALDDGKTIAARLPQAFAELEIGERAEMRARTQAQASAQGSTASAFMMATTRRIEPDLTVITGSGQKFRAHLIGLDGETGLSILQVMGKLPSPAPLKLNELNLGQGIQIFAPEPVKNEVENLSHTTYVKVGIVEATLASVSPEGSTTPDKLIVHGVKFSPAIVGGVACDQFGNTLGIVESIDGNNASIVPASAVQAATKRVLARQASVPRAWLGVRGEPIELAGSAGLLAQGWRADEVKQLMNDQIGILLTTVTPRTPAAVAKLRPGDIIVSVNQKEVKGADAFSDLLGKAGSGEQVQFTIRRPAAPSPFEVPVTLGSSFSPAFEWAVFPDTTTTFLGLERWGIQTLGLGFAARNGLMVVAVQPESAAARSGIRDGDVIESIDGHVIGRSAGTMAFTRQKKHTVWIVRDHEKKQIVLEVEE